MNEDFVPFEFAEKLKEKGFREKCLAYYDVEDNVGLLYNTQYIDEALPCQYTDLLQCHNTGEAETQPDDSGFCVDAPTIPQVLKWLRKEKKIFVEIVITPMGLYKPMIYDIEGFKKPYRDISPRIDFNESALAGIEYCLDNLI